MKFSALAAALAGLIVTSPLAAQSGKPPARPYVPFELRENHRFFCGEGRQSVDLPDSGGMRATFVVQATTDDLVALCLDRIEAARLFEIGTMEHALVALAYRPLEPLWPRMEEQWGNDLVLLRQRLAADARQTQDSGLGYNIAAFVNRAVARASALRNLGYYDESLAVLDQAGARVRDEVAGRRATHLDFENALLAAYRAGTISRVEGDAAAAEHMAQFLETFPQESEYYFNPLINYAAYLAEAGENTQSRQLIEPAYERFRGAPFSSETYQIGGSDREFAWIIACNRWRLDKAEAAQPFIDIVEFSEERPPDEYFAYIKPSTMIERRMYRCIGDADGWFSQFRDGTLPALDVAWVLLQPQWGGDDGPLPEWTMPPELAERFAGLYRELPESYGPAMRRWGEDRSGR